jgi:tetratricopeptide (TPR) repeat protein
LRDGYHHPAQPWVVNGSGCSRWGVSIALRPTRQAARRIAWGPANNCPLPVDLDRMSWWSRLVGGRSDSELKPQRLDYLSEALNLERAGDIHGALTSYRLALRDKQDDERILMNMAIAYTRLAQIDEAIRCYKRALEVKPTLAGAHYGLAFLQIKRGDRAEAITHLEAFLDSPPKSADPANLEHARRALDELKSASDDSQAETRNELPESEP